jgi:hypothetical protein
MVLIILTFPSFLTQKEINKWNAHSFHSIHCKHPEPENQEGTSRKPGKKAAGRLQNGEEREKNIKMRDFELAKRGAFAL